MAKNKEKEIIITIQGGAVQGVKGIPKGVTLIIKDYDCQDEEGEREDVMKDEDGDLFQQMTFIGE